MMSLSLVVIVWTDTRENVHDIKKEFLAVDIVVGIILHARLRFDN